ncbi:MAG: hypothetical protein KTR21_04700 [Rhodobacteraceae bacterium]|nr:hypothetical protein [Paracoccaceae bacterium]
MDQACVEPVWLGVLLSPVSTAAALVVSAPMAWLLVWELRGWRARVAAVVLGSPLVLPLLAVGLYAMLALASGPASCNQGGAWVFLSVAGKTLCAALYATPFVAPPLLAAFQAVDQRVWEAAATLRADRADQFWSVALPMVRPAMLVAGGVGCAQSVAAFGAMALFDARETCDGAECASMMNAGGLILMGSLIATAILRLDPARVRGGQRE